MITLKVNSASLKYEGDDKESLLHFLRVDHNLTALKDGCSGEGVCGACSVEVNGKIMLACRVKMADLNGAEVITPEGLPTPFRKVMSESFASRRSRTVWFLFSRE